MNRILLTLIFSFLFANDQIPAPPQKHPILLKNGVIHTVSNGVIRGAILFEKGKISRIAEHISPPVVAEVIDL